MNFQFYLEKLYASAEFEKFKKENKDAFFCGAFFSIETVTKKDVKPENKFHFDFYVPSDKKIFSFHAEKAEDMGPIPMEYPAGFDADLKDVKVSRKVADNYTFGFETVKNIVLGEMVEKEIKGEIQKVLLSLQNSSDDGKDYLIGTIFISALGLIKIKFSLPDLEVLEFEKKSFMDMFKFIPGKRGKKKKN